MDLCSHCITNKLKQCFIIGFYYKYGARFLLVLGAMKGYEVELRLD